MADYVERGERPFAPQYPRNEQGWISFPRDIEYRRKFFPNKQLAGSVHDVFEHPAKMNLFLVTALAEYISDPGDWVLEPFGGTGSTAFAATLGRNVCLLEIEPAFGEIIKEAVGILVPGGMAVGDWNWMPRSSDRGKYGNVRLIIGDNRQTMPVLGSDGQPMFKAVITSPPYSTALKPGSNPLEVHGREGSLLNYTRSSQNLGNLNPYFWQFAMRDVWDGLFKSLVPGGLIACVNKDIMKDGKRELLSVALIRQAKEVGLEYVAWHKWATPSTIRQETARNKGGTVIEDEDIIVFRRPTA